MATPRPEGVPPEWLTTKPGLPDSVTREVTEEELAAFALQQERIRRFSGTFTRKAMNPDDEFVESAQSAFAFCDANLALFTEQKSSEMVRHFREGKARALRDLGRFAEALDVVSSKDGRALPGFAPLRKEILAWAHAVSRPDSDRCGCKSEPSIVPSPTGNQTITVALPHKSIAGRCWSFEHRKVVAINRCDLCLCLNAYDGVDESIAELEALRADSQAAIIADVELLKKR